MADYDVKLVVTADTEDAKEKLTDLSATRVEPVKVDTKVEPPKIEPPQVAPVKVPVEADKVTVDAPAVAPVKMPVEADKVTVDAPAVEPVKVPIEADKVTVDAPAVAPVKVPVEADKVTVDAPAVEPVKVPVEADKVTVDAPAVEPVKLPVEADKVTVDAPQVAPVKVPVEADRVTVDAPAVEPVKLPVEADRVTVDAPAVEPVKVPVEVAAVDKTKVEPVELKAKAVVGEVAMPTVEPVAVTARVDKPDLTKLQKIPPVEIPVTTQEPTIKPPKPPKVKVPVEADTAKAEAGLKAFVGRMRGLLTGFGLVGLGTMIVGAVSRIVDSFKSASHAAERFREVQSSLANAKAIQGLADEYAALKDAADAAAAAQSRELDMVDREVAARRKLAEAKAEAAKNAEIAAVDTAAPDYDRQVAEIERRYRSERAARSAANAEEDVVLSRQRLGADAASKRREAEAEGARLRELDAKIARLGRDRSKNEIESASLNDADKTTAAGAVGTTLKQLFTLDWGRMADARTEEGDAKRVEAAKKAAADELEIARLVGERKRVAENQKRLAEEAESLDRQAEAKAPEIEAARLQGEAAAQADRNADAKAVADERAATETFAKRLDEIRARAADAAELGAAETDRERAAVYGRRERRETAAFDAAKAKVEAETAKPIGERDETMIARWREDMAKSLSEALGARQSRTDIERSAAREREGRMFEAGPDRQNRLTAMGLGSGVSGAPTIDRHFERVIDLLREQVSVTRDSKPERDTSPAVYWE